MNDIALTPEYLEHLLALGKGVPAGPWGTSLNAFELFGKDFTDWGEVYANLTLDNGHVFKGSVIAHANTNLMSEEEKLAARQAYLEGKKVDPGLSGNIAAYIAAYHPGVTTALIMEILRLQAEVARLAEDFDAAARAAAEESVKAVEMEDQANWLADRCREFCDSHNFCAECPMLRGPYSRTNCQSECGKKIELRFEKNVATNWRNIARKAMKVEDDCE